MNQLLDRDKIRLIAGSTAGLFLLIHILLIIIFYIYHVTPMVYFNVFSILFYLSTFYMLKKNMEVTFVVSVYLEVLVHMSLAEYFLGWEHGFHVTVIGMNILLFFSEYLGRSLQFRYVPAFYMSLLGMSVYLIVCVVDYYHPAAYHLPDSVSLGMQLFWGVTVFVIIIVCLQSFVWLTCRAEQLLAKQAEFDELTGLPNRYYAVRLIKEVDQAGDQESYWVAMADIDNFKEINDTYGHNFGDYVLRTVAAIMKEKLSQVDCCRWGGEEFLMIGRASSDQEEQWGELEQLRRSVEEYPFFYDGRQIHITLTIGVTACQSDQEMNRWIDLADKRLYVGKCSGKNRVVS